MARCQHTFTPLFRAPAQDGTIRAKALLIGYCLHGYDEYRTCSRCGRIESYRRYTRGGRQWRKISPFSVERAREQAQAWGEKLEAEKATQ